MAASSGTDRAATQTAVAAGFLGWTLDAFDYFILTFVVADIAKDFGTDAKHVALTMSASLTTRFIGAIIFGLLADRFGRRLPLILNILYYSLIEVLSGLAPSYTVFLLLRFLYGVGMGGEWGVGASLTMESVPIRWRGILSGLLQEGYAFGNLLAAAVYLLVYPRFGPHWGWRMLFFVGGLPALLTLFVRARVQEPEAWHRSRVTWHAYRHVAVSNWPRFLFIIVFMAAMNMVSHGSQDMYPSFLQHERAFSTTATSVAVDVSMLGAICGGLFFGALSDRVGRRRAIIIALALGIVAIPLWTFAPSVASLLAGGFLMQFMVQGAWGVVPVHLNELSPDQLRGLFPGLAYQLGVLLAALSPFIETSGASRLGYATAMGSFTMIVLIFGIIVVALGPESRGVVFGRGAEAA